MSGYAYGLRQVFATHLLVNGYEIQMIQELLGRRDVSTRMIYADVLNRGAAVVSEARWMGRRRE